ncbi:MAG: DUF58 domain-containing protein [Chromatocurvus sp.]
MAAEDFTRPARGAYADLDALIALRFPARQLDIRRRRRALSRMSGGNRANVRGRGIDFDEVRSYQAGDDIRAIDWRVTARTGSAHTKLYHEERERPVLIAVDQRAGMFFGSQHCFKSVLAAHLAALVTWSALHCGERIGGVVFSDTGHRDIRPRRSRKTALGLLSTVTDFNHRLRAPGRDSIDGFANLLAMCRRIARPGASLVIISDFDGLLQQRAQEHLFQLSRHIEITALHCTDALEHQLPPPGEYAVSDGMQRSVLSTASGALRRQYSAQASDYHAAIAEALQRVGVPCCSAGTGDSPFELLQGVYGSARA